MYRSFSGLVLLKLDEKGPDDGRDDRHAANEQRHIERRRRNPVNRAAEKHGCHDGYRVGLVQVSGHTRAVTHVVTDVVRDNACVAGIVFREIGFYFAHQVRAHVGGFRVDAAAHTGEDAHE